MRIVTLSAAIAAAALLAVAPAHASDTKIYPGTWCVPELPPGAGNNNTWIQGSFMNDQASSSYFCPIIKTVNNNPKLESVEIKVSTPANGSVSCSLYMGDLDTLSPIVGTNPKSATGANQTITFTDFGSGQANPWGANTWNAYHIYCSFSNPVGTVGTIQRYTVREAGTANTSHKIYPNTMCKEKSTPAPVGTFHHSWDYLEWDIHDSTRASLSCPVIADRMSNTTATAVAEIAIGRPFPSNPTVTCDILAMGSYGTLLDSKSATVQPGDQFDIARVNLDLAKSASWGRYQITCSAGSGDPKILSYRVQEN